jgi:hypothetical protein
VKTPLLRACHATPSPYARSDGARLRWRAEPC